MCCFNKIFLFIINLITFVFGVGVIVIASMTINRANDYDELFELGIIAIPIWVLVFGLGVSIVGFLGCFGAVKESRCMLYTYASVMLAILIGEIVLGAFLLVKPTVIQDQVKKAMTKQFSKYTNKEPADETLNKLIDEMQEDLKCCGVDGYADWYSQDFAWHGNLFLPRSCCQNPSVPCSGLPLNRYQDGCYTVFKDVYDELALALGIAAIVLAFVLIFSVTTSCGIARNSKRDRSQYA